MKNNCLSRKEVKMFQMMLENKCGKDSFEYRLFKHIGQYIDYCSFPVTHEEEICLALADVYDN